MRKMKSRCEINVHVDNEPPTGERVIKIGVDDEVDMDEVVRPARAGRPAMSLAEALGQRAAFTRESDGVEFAATLGRVADFDDVPDVPAVKAPTTKGATNVRE